MAKIRKFAAFVLVALGCIGTSQVKAQGNPSSYYVEDPRTFYGGLLLGTNFSQVDGDSYAGYRKVGFNAGGIMYFHLGQNLAGSIELLFSQKGARGHRVQEGPPGFNISKYIIHLNYAEVPLQINYFDRRRSHFGGGFSYSQMISSKETIEVTDGTGNVTTVNAEPYKFNKSDINFILGGNLHLVKGLFLNLRFQYSIIPIRKDIPPGYGRAERYNNLWALRLMYLF